jgi:hypothetical protein
MEDGDVLEVGGRARAVTHLAIGPLPQAPRYAHAVLQIALHESRESTARSGLLVVHETHPFRGQRLTHHRAPPALGPPVGTLHFRAGTGPVLRFGVTEAIRQAQRSRRSMMFVSLRAADGTAQTIRLASPRHPDARRRPRLELLGP